MKRKPTKYQATFVIGDGKSKKYTPSAPDPQMIARKEIERLEHERELKKLERELYG